MTEVIAVGAERPLDSAPNLPTTDAKNWSHPPDGHLTSFII